MAGHLSITSTDAPPAQLSDVILELLAHNTLCSMASVTPTGGAHINTAYFVSTESGVLYVFTDPATQHAQNWAQNGSVALTVFDSHQDWRTQKRGLQLFGTVTQAAGEDEAEALSLYLIRYPGLSKWVKQPADLSGLDSRFYKIALSSFKILDELTFGEDTYVSGVIKR